MQKRNTILIADDSELSRRLLSDLFGSSYPIIEAEDGKQTLDCVHKNLNKLALVLLDLVMPAPGGLEVMRILKDEGILEKVPIIIITSQEPESFMSTAYELGAADIIYKPFNTPVIKRRVQNVIELYSSKIALETLVEKQSHALRAQNASMARQAEKINQLNSAVIDTLSNLIEYRNFESGQHIKRIRMFTKALLDTVSLRCPQYLLTAEEISMISGASAMHDIGKIAIPDAVLLKPARLTTDEFEIMKQHTVKGCDILHSLRGIEDERYLSYCLDICRYHHEKWNGAGYPEGLAGDAIPICAQVVSLADCYDALTNARVYKPAYTHEEAAAMIINGECGQFSEQLLSCFRETLPLLHHLSQRYADGTMEELPASAAPIPSLAAAGEESQKVKNFVNDFYHTYLELRDFTTVPIFLDENITSFGTGAEETCHGLQDVIFALQNRESNYKTGFHFTHQWSDAQSYGAGLWLVRGEINLEASTDIPSFSGLYLRYSIVCRETQDGFKILHLHSSAPCENQDAGQIVPHRVTKDYNRVLQQMLAEKDRELDLTNHELVILSESIPGGVKRCLVDDSFTMEYMSKGLLDLLGYSRTEIQSIFHDEFLPIICPADRDEVLHQVDEQLTQGNDLELSYRVMCKDGLARWILNRGRVTVDEAGRKLATCVLVDVTSSHQAQEALRISEERYRIISEQSDDIIFDYNIAQHAISHTSSFSKKFGYNDMRDDFPHGSIASGVIHPDDAELFLSEWNRILEDGSHGAIEIRIKKWDESYIWCRVQITTLRGDDGSPSRLVGNIVDIDHIHREKDALVLRAQRDALTGLYNAPSTRELVEDYLDGPGHSGTHAMLMMDIDNFKGINDSLGHLFGDAVLSETAFELQKLFRSTDILGRIGGDEFLIFIKDVLPEQAEARAAEVTEALRRSFTDNSLHCSTTGSVGVVLFPRDGSSYVDLFRKADSAMYHAKRNGRNRFCVYADVADDAEFFGSALSAIDPAGRTAPKVFGDNITEYIFRIFYETKSIYHAMNSVLALIGKYFDVSRAYVFENNFENTACSNTFEWCNDGVKSQKDGLQNVPYSSLGNYRRLYNEEGVLYCPDVSMLKDTDLREILGKQNIVSLLHVAIISEGKQKGYIGFDTCVHKLYPLRATIETLQMVSNILSTFLIKKRAQDHLTKSLSITQFVIDKLELWVYVIDPATHELLFINQNTTNVVPKAKVGSICYNVLQNMDSPCKTCPMYSTNPAQEVRVYNHYLNLWTDCTSARIQWIDGRDVCLMSCKQVVPAAGDEACAPAVEGKL